MTSLILQYKLQRGRYVRDHCKVQVLLSRKPTSLQQPGLIHAGPKTRHAHS